MTEQRNGKLTRKELAAMIDHTNLKADASPEAIEKLCREAAECGFAMVAINPANTERCAALLKGTGVHVGACIGFPLGQNTVETKVFEAVDAIRRGADEIDYVLNVSELKAGHDDYVEREMREIVAACRKEKADVLIKVIFENCYLTREEIVRAAKIAAKVKPDFIKTSTGFGTGGAKPEDVRLMKEAAGGAIRVKAAGGIRDTETALAMIAAGADRIGTSAGVAILEGLSGT